MHKIKNMNYAMGGLALLVLPCAVSAQKRMNVLMLIADDMRPEMGCYGVDYIKTPNIDRLASEGTQFMSAYCNIPVSGASRASLLTGMYPNYPKRFREYNSFVYKDAPGAIVLPGWFKDNGYHTVSNGKVFHNIEDNADAWSEAPWRAHPDGYDVYWAEYNRWEQWMNKESGNTINPKTMRGPFCERGEAEDDRYDDYMTASKTIKDLERLSAQQEPFFLACGFWRPHLPFCAPARYWDLYDRNLIPMADNMYRSKGLPEEVVAPTEMFSYARVTSLEDEAFQREAKHGYWACMSFIDAQIGRVLDELEKLGLKDNTIVVLFGDHGWQLGEHSFWGKHTLMERSTHVPLIVRVPGEKSSRTYSPVEFVDLFPSLCDLCNIPSPKNGQLDGTSFKPIIRNPKHRTKDYVFIQWQGGDNAQNSRYNYAEWQKKDGIMHKMLFDHQTDQNENLNVTGGKKYRKTERKMSEFIRKTKQTL